MPDSRIQTSGLAGKRVVLCVREGVECLQLRLAMKRDHLVVVGESNTGDQLLEIVSRERPDIVLVDTNALSSEDLARRLLAEHPATLILLTDLPGDQERAAQIGAAACLERPYSAADLLDSLQQAVIHRSAP